MKFCIKELREKKGISQTLLAKKSGITRATIWKLETGENVTTTTHTLVRLADALGVPVGELFLPDNV